MKTALAHDFLVKYGGAEKVLQDISEAFPQAPIFTTLQKDTVSSQYFSDREIRTSYLQKYYNLIKNHRLLLAHYPKAVESLNFDEFDTVISSSHSFINGIITKSDTTHICYCHTPTRYLWDTYHTYLDQQGLWGPFRTWTDKVLHNLRKWDRQAADRVDHWIANSATVKRRIKKYYNQEAKVIYPGIDTSKYSANQERGDYFVILSRLSPYKNINLAIEVFNELEIPLIIMGEGDDRSRLESLSEDNIEFLGFVVEEEKIDKLERARGLIFPGRDDFGLVPVEAQAAGTPVIALGQGGALETVASGKTGVFFDRPTADELKDAIEHFLKIEGEFNREQISQHAEQFSVARFKRELTEFVANVT